MTKRVIAGILILLLLVSFSLFSERYLRRTTDSLLQKAGEGDSEAFQTEFLQKKVFLQILLDDSSVGDLELAGKQMSSSEFEMAEEGRRQVEEILYRIGDENFFSLVKLF